MDYARTKALIRLTLGETDSDNSFWTDAEIDAMINDSQVQVATDTQALLTFATAAMIVGDGSYSLPTDFLQLKTVEITKSATQQKTLVQVGFDEFDRSSHGNTALQGEPSIFRLEIGGVNVTDTISGNVCIYPTPDSTNNIKIWYYQKPTALSATTDVTELPEPLHWSVVYHAAAMLSLKTSDQTKFQNVMVLYERQVRSFNQMMSRVNRGKPGHPQDTMGYGQSSLLGPGHPNQVRRGPLT